MHNDIGSSVLPRVERQTPLPGQIWQKMDRTSLKRYHNILMSTAGREGPRHVSVSKMICEVTHLSEHFRECSDRCVRSQKLQNALFASSGGVISRLVDCALPTIHRCKWRREVNERWRCVKLQQVLAKWLTAVNVWRRNWREKDFCWIPAVFWRKLPWIWQEFNAALIRKYWGLLWCSF